MRAGVLEDLQHAGACDLPDLGAELLPIQDHQVLQTVCPRPSQLLVVCRGKEDTSEKSRLHTKTGYDRNPKSSVQIIHLQLNALIMRAILNCWVRT